MYERNVIIKSNLHPDIYGIMRINLSTFKVKLSWQSFFLYLIGMMLLRMINEIIWFE